jgi:putative copper resistance protein D
VHVLFAGIWLGGLVTLALIRDLVDRDRLGTLMRRYSTLALLSFVVVAVTGYVSAEIRVSELANLLSPYGILVLVKVAALLTLGLLGAAQRRVFIRRMTNATASRPRGWFWAVIALELAFMGIASGVAAALARTATPVVPVSAADLADPTPAELLTGRPLPPPVSFETLFTLWNVDVIWLLVCAFGILFYVWGVVRLRRRGDSWPWYRTVFWVAGFVALFWVTNGGVNVYERYLFSSHMLAHMTLGMLIPILLVPGAPITLALRTIEKRHDGSRGPREWIMLLVHSRYFAVLSNPLVAAGIFTGSLWLFYYTPLFSWATTNHVGHQWMIIHFLLSGYLFVQSLIGVDPAPNRPPYPIRLVVLLATMAFHAFFGLAIISGTGLLLSDWYGAMGWEGGLTAIQDQQAGGGIAWSVGEVPNAILAVTIAIMWARSDDRESKRYDRKADRDGDAELEEYNRMLADRAARR